MRLRPGLTQHWSCGQNTSAFWPQLTASIRRRTGVNTLNNRLKGGIPVEGLEFFDGASAALSLMTRLRELLEHCENEQDPSLRETLIQLKAYSLRSAEGLRATLDRTLHELQTLDVSMD